MAQSFYPTALQVIDAALSDIGVTDSEGGLTPSTEQRAKALSSMNFMVTAWQALGMQVWCQKTATYILADGVNNPTMGPSGNINVARPLSVNQVWIRNVDATPDTDRFLTKMSREEYNELSGKLASGVPHSYFYDPEYDLPGSNSGVSAKGRLYLYPTPDAATVATYDLYVVYTRPIQDFASSSDNLDFPQEWFEAVKWNLAFRLGPSYEVPIEKMGVLRTLARDTLELAMSNDRDQGSLHISPAQQ